MLEHFLPLERADWLTEPSGGDAPSPADAPRDDDGLPPRSALRSDDALRAVAFNLAAPQRELRREASSALAAARVLGAGGAVDALLDAPLPGGGAAAGAAARSVRQALADGLADDDANAAIALCPSGDALPPAPLLRPAVLRPPPPQE